MKIGISTTRSQKKKKNNNLGMREGGAEQNPQLEKNFKSGNSNFQTLDNQ